MDFIKNNIVANLPFILLAVALVVFQYLMRKRRGTQGPQQDVVQDLLGEVRLDFRLAEIFVFDYRAKQFMTTTWQINKSRLDFLDAKVLESVNGAFEMAVDINRQISEAKKHKSATYMTAIDIEKFKRLLAESQKGLEQWLLLKVGSKNPPLKTPGMFDDLLGRR